MTNEELKEYYANLLIIQYANKDKARETVKAFVDLVISNQIYLSVQDAYNLDTAVGVQLDVLGKYAGVSRTGTTFTGKITLNDDDYRTLIRLAIIKNNAGSSLYDIQELINRYFAGLIYVFDFKNMRMGYYISSQIATQGLAQMFVAQNLLPIPMGVALSSTIYFPVLNSFFGFRTYNFEAFNSVPFNSYSSFQTNWYWLSYSYEIGSPSTYPESLLTESGNDRIVQEDGSLLYI